MPNPLATAPPSESLRDELSAVVGDEVVRPLSRPLESSFEESPHRGRARQRTINGESHDPPREVIDGHGEPPAKRPNLRQGEGNPRGPEAECCGNRGQINMPEVIRMSGSDHGGDSLRSLSGPWPPSVPKHSSDRRRPQMESRTGQDLSEFHLPQRWAEDSETFDEVGNKLRELVHRFGQADQGIRAFLIETPHPGRNREGGHQEIRAVCARDQPRAARSSRIANRATGG